MRLFCGRAVSCAPSTGHDKLKTACGHPNLRQQDLQFPHSVVSSYLQFFGSVAKDTIRFVHKIGPSCSLDEFDAPRWCRQLHTTWSRSCMYPPSVTPCCSYSPQVLTSSVYFGNATKSLYCGIPCDPELGKCFLCVIYPCTHFSPSTLSTQGHGFLGGLRFGG